MMATTPTLLRTLEVDGGPSPLAVTSFLVGAVPAGLLLVRLLLPGAHLQLLNLLLVGTLALPLGLMATRAHDASSRGHAFAAIGLGGLFVLAASAALLLRSFAAAHISC